MSMAAMVGIADLVSSDDARFFCTVTFRALCQAKSLLVAGASANVNALTYTVYKYNILYNIIYCILTRLLHTV